MEINKILFTYLKTNKYDEFTKYLKQNPTSDLNIRDETSNYLITYAIVKNNKDIVNLLLQKGCRIDVSDQDGRSLIYLPIKFGYDDILKLIIDYDKHNIGISIIDFKDSFQNIPIHYAIFFKNMYAIDMLLENNSNLNMIDENGNNALHLAIYSKNYEICKKVIDKDVNINSRTSTGESALHIACNFELIDIIKLLINNGADINIQDYNNEITPLMYAVTINNNTIAKLLITNGADPNIQDFIGNTVVHYAVEEENYEILYELLKLDINKMQANVNISNINGKLPIHILLEKDKIYENNIIETLIINSNLNIQDDNGNTALHLICKNNIWETYKNILSNKKLNIFIENYEKKRPIDYIDKKEIDAFMNLVSKSYLYVLRNFNFIWKEDWENLCNKELFYNKLTNDELKIISKYIKKTEDNVDVCYKIVNNKLHNIYKSADKCGYSSYPVKNSRKCIDIEQPTKVELCSFVGITLDILFGLIYLLNKHKHSCSTISSNFRKNDDLCNYYLNLGIKTSKGCDFYNFEIVWVYKKLFFSENFHNNFKKCLVNKQIRFIIIPLGIEIEKGSHANYLIFDKKNYELERFEPYGSHSPYKFNYNSKLLDNILSFKFTELDSTIKYISPDKYLPKIGFQYYDVYESKTGKIGDPGGFCALWSIWYTDMRLTYSDISRDNLVNKLLKTIKAKNISFKNLIRNYSVNITKLRDNIFTKSDISINDWLNDQYTEKQYNDIINEITIALSKYVK
ncbi:ankyrin repeat protein [Fadolivirus algeromassiliense]|jgi:ankyrin repeat protein|uniref:Ankyrin repeat protein n=1 Tax=Fadolivirus FV1/VV64 TaxID=3070911 RepID=A0A7D3V5F9_9VIRU|nr:ankyrin repeat protein [Fadolivirus algeromassiliense]QKF93772.1 ankyrin repeat protein [Fadolivirus FV1/VV64]